MMSRSKSGLISKRSSSVSSIWRCWAETHTIGSIAGRAAQSAWTTGAILIVSGRVPKTGITRSGLWEGVILLIDAGDIRGTETTRDRDGRGTQHDADGVDEEHRLTDVEPVTEDELMMEVPSVGFGDPSSGAGPPDDRGGGIQDRQGQDDHRDQQADRDRALRDAHDRDRRKDVTDEERTRVAQDDLRGIEVVWEKPQGRPDQGGQHERDHVVAVFRRYDEERQRRDRADAREQAVQPVDEVDRVHHPEIPNEGQRDRDP